MLSGLILVLILIGVALALFPMDARIKQLIYVVAVVLVILVLWNLFGGYIGRLP